MRVVSTHLSAAGEAMSESHFCGPQTVRISKGGGPLLLSAILCLAWPPLAATQPSPLSQSAVNSATHDQMELATDATLAQGETAMLDAWFNSQQWLNAGGQKEYFHYMWRHH